MPRQSPVEILNQLLALHTRSLPTYLLSAKPWVSNEAAQAALTVLEQIAADQGLVAGRIVAVIRDEHGTPASSEFPINFTDMHDLSMDYIMAEVQARQEREIEFIEWAVENLAGAAAPGAIAEEALGAAKAHLDSLRELGVVSTA